MRSLFLVIAAVFAAAVAPAVAADIKLPAPKKTGGMPLFEAIDQRGSAVSNDFPRQPVSREELATVLWAATGSNRDGKLWTVPMAMGRPPYCKIYVTSDEGVFLYDWETHALKEISKAKVQADIIMQDAFKNAPLALFIVVDGEEVAKFNSPIRDESGPLLAGAMSQNIYLACEGLGLGTRLLYSIRRNIAREQFKLGPKEEPLFGLPIGKK